MVGDGVLRRGEDLVVVGDDVVGRQPNVAMLNSSSSAFSAKWVWRRTSSLLASSADRTIRSSVTENGEHGASATLVIAPNDRS